MFNGALLGDVRLILASASPRRSDILRQTMPDASFEVRPSDVEENLDKSAYKSDPSLYVVDTARLKATDIFHKVTQEDQSRRVVVIGADTVVTYGGVIYEKPPSKSVAESYLKTLSGKTHKVYTGVVVLNNFVEPKETAFAEGTGVTFDTLDNDVIKSYIETGEPMDKAGGYGIQARGAALITKIDGCYFNVMGFPLHRFAKTLREIMKKVEKL